MPDPLLKYKTYHRNPTNIAIHQVCVPMLLLSFYSVIPVYAAFCANIFYSMTFLLFDVLSKKSIHSACYMQTLFLVHFIFRWTLSTRSNMIIHAVSWLLQIVGHRCFEHNTPAFIDNLYDSFLFAPYFTFIETFYPTTFDPKCKYTIINDDYDTTKKTIIYFAGLFQRSQTEYKCISKTLNSHNHIYINTNLSNNDIYRDTVGDIMTHLQDLNLDIECIVGFSFGGSLALQFKELYMSRHNIDIKSVLIAPAGFGSGSRIENMIRTVGKWLYSLYGNDKWYMIQTYPTYQNTNQLGDTDFIIVSNDDYIHNPSVIKHHPNCIAMNHVSHLNMIHVVGKQRIIPQLIQVGYEISTVKHKPPTSGLNKLIFGSHFPYI
jgi:uncharacterized membrane protein YGL010W